MFTSNVFHEAARVRVPAGATFGPAPATGPLWLHHGSLISQCSEADRPTETWPSIVARHAHHSLLNLGIGGQCHLDQFMARAIRDLPAHAISLEVGINIVNAASLIERSFLSAFHGFLDTVRDGHPDTPILIITPIICPSAENRPGSTLMGPDHRYFTPDRPAEMSIGALSLTRIRELLRGAVKLRQSQGDASLQLLDGLELFGPDDVVDLPEGLHPNADGYRRMAQRFLPLAQSSGLFSSSE